jgi:hypothetical protein
MMHFVIARLLCQAHFAVSMLAAIYHSLTAAHQPTPGIILPMILLPDDA